ncbi:SCP2 sterol-binding domain-containing protein [Gammaproteobacteria bacterium]|nr:SCP2 sterol-binding domain-containing protein [Gammaproteobacteria bacterium]
MTLFATLALAPLELLIDRLIAHDPYTAERLSRFDGRAIEVLARPRSGGKLPLLIVVRGSTLKLNLASADALHRQVDARIEGSLGTLLELLLTPADRRALSNPDLSISGDAELIQALYHFASDLDLKWEDYLAPFLGDLLTREAMRASDAASQWGSDAAASLTETLDEYLVEEARILPSADEIDYFNDSVAALRLRLDRLDARLRLLENADA